MKKFGVMTALVVLSFILQTSLFNFFNIFGTIPNVSLILTVIFAMMSNGITGGIIGIMTGVMYDAMLYNVFGIYTLVYFVIGAVVGSYSDSMMRENYVAYCAVTGISTIVMHFLLYLVLFFLRYSVDNAVFIMRSILLEAAMNTVLAVFVLKFIIFIFDRLNVK